MSDTAHARRRTVRGDGLDLSVWESGPDDAPTVVLVHGYPDTHAVWDGVTVELADRFHVVTHDVRGAGASGVPRSRAGWDLDHLVNDIGAVIDTVSPDRPVHLVGHDWGSIQGWEAVTCGRLDGRIASYTSISGPAVDHVAHWFRRRIARRNLQSLREVLRQAVKSWYVLAFQLPFLPEVAWRRGVPERFTEELRTVEGIGADTGYPAPTLAADGERGVNLYRRNMLRRLRRPRRLVTDVPVQLLVPLGDRFVTPALLDDTGGHVLELVRHDLPGGHWLPVTDPHLVADHIADHALAHPAAPSGTTATTAHSETSGNAQ